jgi:S-adenosylmethionine:tRNA ribosyltransferase-isomerase
MKLKLADFNYSLPPELIAQKPVSERANAKLMVLHDKGEIEHRKFWQIVDYLQSGDVLVLNNTKVMPVRLCGRKSTGGKIEVLILPPEASTGIDAQPYYECLIKGKRLRVGTELLFDAANTCATDVRAQLSSPQLQLRGIIVDKVAETRFKVKFYHYYDVLDNSYNKSGLNATKRPLSGEVCDEEPVTFNTIVNTYGSMPLPPYIKTASTAVEDKYQTVYAVEDGSIAAPTAGLHFTTELLHKIEALGVNIVYITLHIGTGTFLPVRNEDISMHSIASEYFKVSKESAIIINRCKAEGRRLIAVGTTTVRALESCADAHGKIHPFEGKSDLFIYPPYSFKSKIDMLITNFHLPKSTLLMLVSAYAGRNRILTAYREAIAHKYRFYSFGDAMLIYRPSMN